MMSDENMRMNDVCVCACIDELMLKDGFCVRRHLTQLWSVCVCVTLPSSLVAMGKAGSGRCLAAAPTL